MGIKYCTSKGCGAKTEYSVKPPKFCSACGFEFAKAFAAASLPDPIIRSPEPIRAPMPKRRRPPQDVDSQGDEDDRQPDEYEVRALANELVASVRGDIVIRPQTTFGVRLGDLLQNPDRFAGIGQRTAEVPNIETE